MELRDLLNARTTPPVVRTIGLKILELVARGDRRLDELERTGATFVLVDTVADLPASAGPREFFRVRTGTAAERLAVYVGNGPSQPLGKLTITLV